MAELDRISDELAAATLAPLDADQRERLLRAQAEVRRLLAISMVSIAPEDPASADARWCLGHYFAELAERFEETFDPARTLPTAPEDLFLLARFDGQPAGCGVLKALDPDTGELLRMWVDRPHRGLGIAGRLLDALERHASARGHTAVRLTRTARSTRRRRCTARAATPRSPATTTTPTQPLVREAAVGLQHRARLTARAHPPRRHGAVDPHHAALAVEPRRGRARSASRTCAPTGSAGSRAPRRAAASAGRSGPSARRQRPAGDDDLRVHLVTRSRPPIFSPRPGVH